MLQEVSCRAVKNGKEPKWRRISGKKGSVRIGIRKKFVNMSFIWVTF